MFELIVAGVLILFAVSAPGVAGEDLLVPAVSFVLVLVPLLFLLFIERSKVLEGVKALKNFRFLLVILVSALSLYFTPLFGFSIMSSLLTLFYVLMLGERRFSAIFLLLLIWNAVYFGVFIELLHVPVPAGEIFVGQES